MWLWRDNGGCSKGALVTASVTVEGPTLFLALKDASASPPYRLENRYNRDREGKPTEAERASLPGLHTTQAQAPHRCLFCPYIYKVIFICIQRYILFICIQRCI